MSLVLQILGVTFVVLLLIVAVAIIVIRQKLRGFVSDLGEMVSAAPPRCASRSCPPTARSGMTSRRCGATLTLSPASASWLPGTTSSPKSPG
mgnify:CR=1 FL=1